MAPSSAQAWWRKTASLDALAGLTLLGIAVWTVLLSVEAFLIGRTGARIGAFTLLLSSCDLLLGIWLAPGDDRAWIGALARGAFGAVFGTWLLWVGLGGLGSIQSLLAVFLLVFSLWRRGR